jgi:putative holliday junction resolvase
MRNLGLDVGDRRIGVAMSDPEGILASPVCTLVRNDEQKTLAQISEMIKNNDVGKIIIGMPYSLKGYMNEQTEKVITFTENLKKLVTIPIEYQDERFSTVTAEQMMIQAGKKSRKRKQTRDSAAAALILQEYLDINKKEYLVQ